MPHDPAFGEAAKRAREDDRSWFSTYPHRRFRGRDAIPHEFGANWQPDSGMQRFVVVRASDLEKRPLHLPWGNAMPDQDEELERLFQQSDSRQRG